MINHMSYALDQLPEVRSYLENVDRMIVPGDYSSFWQAVDGFELLLNPQRWQQFYASVVRRAADEPTYNGGRDWNVHGFLICESEKFHFSIRSTIHASIGRNVIDPRSLDSVMTASTMTAPSVMVVASSAGATFNVFRLPSGTELDVFDPSILIERHDSVFFPSWCRINVDAPRETLELNPVPGEDYCIIELAMRSSIAQRWEFDRISGVPSCAVLLSRDTVVICSMLGEIARCRHRPALRHVIGLLDHADFNVRWAAAGCLCALDIAEGAQALEKLTFDSHPYVRSVAAVSLRSMGGVSNAS